MRDDIKIITSYEKEGSDYWNSRVTYIGYTEKSKKLKNRFIRKIVSVFDDMALLYMYLRISIKKEYDVLVVYRNRAANIFLMLQGIFGKRIPVVMLNCFWRIPNGRMAKFFRRINLKLMLRGASKIIVFASHEIGGYVEHFQVSKEKFVYVPYYFTPTSTSFAIKDEGYIFSGGDARYRDYWNLINAVEGLDIKCKIATQVPEFFDGQDVPDNVEIFSLPEDKYFKCMAESKMMVVPLRGDHFRSTGQRTYLNAMLMGKPTIVCDIEGIKDYMENQKEGIILEPSDEEALKKAIQWVIDNPEDAAVMGARAKVKAEMFTMDITMKRIVDVCEKEAKCA